MITLSPMLACPGSVAGLIAIFYGFLSLWGFAGITTIASFCLALRKANGSQARMRNLGFIAVYVLLGVGVVSGYVFKGNDAIGIVLIFLVPGMAAGHFLHSFEKYRKEREARRRTENSQPEPVTLDLEAVD